MRNILFREMTESKQIRKLAEGAGFEPAKEITPLTRLAGGRTRPLCDPSENVTTGTSSSLRRAVPQLPGIIRDSQPVIAQTAQDSVTPANRVVLTDREARAMLLPLGTRIRLVANGCTGRIYSRSWPTDPTPYCCFIDAKPHSEQGWYSR